MKLSQRVLNMEESATLLMAKNAREMQAQGIEIINLSLGEPDFDTPYHIREAAKEGLDKGLTRYTPVNGLLELRKAISEKFKRDNDLEYSPDQIVVSNGAKQSIANIFFSILDNEDEVIMLSPYWVSYGSMIQMAGGIPIEVKGSVEENFKPSVSKIKAAITPKTKALIFSSPCNPTGAVWSEGELTEMAEMLESFPDIIIISDEIYEFITYGPKAVSIASLPNMIERSVTVNGFSKGFAMTGWRLGYIGAPLPLAQACTKVQGQYTSGANAFSQYAGAVALNSNYAASFKMKEAYEQRKQLVMNRIKEIPGFNCPEPDGAFYAFPDVSDLLGLSYEEEKINTADDLSMLLLNKAHVAVVTGAAFGAPNCIRLSFATSESQINKAFDAIKSVVLTLK